MSKQKKMNNNENDSFTKTKNHIKKELKKHGYNGQELNDMINEQLISYYHDDFMKESNQKIYKNLDQIMRDGALALIENKLVESFIQNQINIILTKIKTSNDLSICLKKSPYEIIKILSKQDITDLLVKVNVPQKNKIKYMSNNGSINYVQYKQTATKLIIEQLAKKLPMKRIQKAFDENPLYKNVQEQLKAKEQILNEMPERLIDFFPKARAIKRHFILHIGDTNSGKTYQALEDLRNAATGTYLGPLRLLALEVQDKMLQNGVLCSMTTGEEENIIDNATHISSTVEKANFNIKYEVAVIDEAQLIEDEDRGGSWTNAILGICADRIHICMSENAREIIIALINSCDDTYEIVEHIRNTELKFEKEKFRYPSGIRKHDALIVFSRKEVLRLADELERENIHASIIYGALPYSVRKSEMEKFLSGKTSVIVSTDAIGMGLNLPIERIIFMDSEKYDGKEVRYLRGPEVKQIAGRAGRRGMYEIGYVNAVYDKEMLRNRLNEKYKSIDYAMVSFPQSLTSINGKLSNALISWENIPNENMFKKVVTNEVISRCKYVERFSNISKETCFRLILMPFDSRNITLENIWYDLVRSYSKKNLLLEKLIDGIPEGEDLYSLETNYKILDLYFSFSKAIGIIDDILTKLIKEKRESISEKIIETRSTGTKKKRHMVG